ncbi:MAG TPA: sigma-54-dependent Fis family transcriptional regulator [Marinilabiliales bacterium]|nr:MAG: sigma-54-dependent Fis family transcriptional regulator [Bacteroidetes bacterium GWA2_40_14]OFX57626.1 MAG: sigma-54-dependent Fis family transcriptional regulator [Bacteroidetes bacterium GWC2_40_13]OFX73522.1 MAG: sigma-54-dependent Fis family transcriptional regulator [Bacteroidetes bacterium GWD2_40_43]OFX90802.1 MAG: sigma-54-dependent Fis family transcriptional regulator [Bacteroidetes bacterium GWE2_40_63]OFY20566.1 MAG: sigma-54-dependent Fis family transcriptional regulator [Ba
MDVQQVKQRFGIIGNTYGLLRAIDIAIQVAPTDLTVLISGESGTGKETFPKIIHQHSSRKHGQYIAVNCGAIPEGTIDSELFGHEKGAFTGATDTRKGYFEVADNGTIFLDEIAELPLSTQVRLLRVLESGEFIRVGSSKVMKTNVRVVAASNVNMVKAVDEGKFREDLYYRLNTVPIHVPPLRERKEDVYLLFRKFATDFADKFRMPALTLSAEAKEILENYRWPGNVRQLKNITEQISILEESREVSANTLKKYLPQAESSKLPALYKKIDEQTFNSEREILYKVLFDMKNDMTDLKRLVHDLMNHGIEKTHLNEDHARIIKNLYEDTNLTYTKPSEPQTAVIINREDDSGIQIEDTEEFIEESLSLTDKEKEMIIKALEKHNGKRKQAADDLGISERTLYRKIKEYDIDL